MNIELLAEKVEKLESVFANILYLKPEASIVSPTVPNLEDLSAAIDAIFTDNKCIGVHYTLNTDKPFFGVRISPVISAADTSIILVTDEPIKLVKYEIEFDSKLFEIGLDKSELAALTLFEISSIMDNPQIFDDLRAYIDFSIVNNEDLASIRANINAAQLIIFGIKDTMRKLGSVMHKTDEEVVANPVIQAAELTEAIVSARGTIDSSIAGASESMRTARPVILQWMFMMYRDIKINAGVIKDVLTDAKAFTASKLEIADIDKTLAALARITDTIIVESKREEPKDLIKFIESTNMRVLAEASLFKSLKKNGLRGIENDLYEYKLRVKNCTDPDEANLIMRSINSRIGILDDYLMNEELSDHDMKHWQGVANDYRDLRLELTKKKLSTKQWGVFINYDALDRMYPDHGTNAE
jgi:hypothetical protein